jgi:hypothetical protein
MSYIRYFVSDIKISGIMLKSIIQLKLSLVHSDKYTPTFIILNPSILFKLSHLLKILFFPLVCIFDLFVKKQLFKDEWT